MSWAAHDLEPYQFRAKLGARISIVWCLIGSYSPDVLTKWAVYGWYIWVLAINDFHPHLDWSFGAPHWAPRQGPR